VNQTGQRWLEGAIGGRTSPLVPLVVLHDGSAFARGACASMRALAREPGAKAIVYAEWSERDEALAGVAHADFRVQIHPAQLWDGHPPWVVAIADLSTGSAADELEALLRPMGACVRLPILKGEFSAADAAAWTKRLEFFDQPVFFLSTTAPIRRTADQLALGAAVYALSSWEAYARLQDGNWRHAMGLVEEGRVFSIGMASDQPDWAFHAHTWRSDLRREVARAWSAQGGSAVRPDYPTPLQVAIQHCPSDNYRTRNEEDERVGALTIGQTHVSFAFVNTPVPPGLRSASPGDALAARVHRLRRFREFILLSERQAAERLLVKKSRLWFQSTRERLVTDATIPARPLGALKWLRSLFEHWEGYFSFLTGAKVRAPQGFLALEDNIKRLRSREARRPSWASALLRFALIAVGTFWTIWGTFFWANRAHPWDNPDMRLILFVSGGGLLLLFLAVVGQALLMQLACERAERFARDDILTAYLAGVVERIKKLLGERVAALRKEVEFWQGSLRELIEWVEGLGADTEAVLKPGNGNPRFPENSLAPLLTRTLPDMVEQVHAEVRDAVGGDARWPIFERVVWQKAMDRAIERQVCDRVASIRYDDCAQAVGWTDSARRALMDGLMADARRPAFAADPVPHAHVTLAASPAWKSSVDASPAIRITGDNGAALLAVAAVPLRQIDMVVEDA
jgi:hypothetical protein